MESLMQQAGQVSPLFSLVPLVVFIPITGLLINLIFGRKLGEKGTGLVASLASAGAFVIAVLQAVAIASGETDAQNIHFLDWIRIGDLEIPWGFRVDTLSVTMMLVVSGVGTLIHIYATGYMHEDVRHNGDPGRYTRFFVYFNLFIAAMMVLVSADNYLMLFVGWEGVGLCSYLLIGFWYEKGDKGIGNALAGKKAFITNRIGDFGFIIAALLMFNQFGTFQFDRVFHGIPEASAGILMAITLFMVLGVTGKSAQIPLYVWLPDAMAGPTPVSALIHAATMVTAGVYLVARSGPLFQAAPELVHSIVPMIGAITALFAATIALAQFDIKKVLAYSTISQLGFMVAAVGMGAYVAGMFHLITHAFFKALLFLSAGSVIQGMEKGEHHVAHDPHLKKSLKQDHHFDVQDMRNMGGMRTRMKTTFWVYLIGAIALAGIPPLAGFWSKDEILAEGLHLNTTVYVLLTITALLTAFYSGRQIFMVFFGAPRSEVAAHAEESPKVMTIPLMVLAVLALLGGLLNLPWLHTLSDWLNKTLTAFPLLEAAGEAEHAVEGAAAGGFNPTVAIFSTVLAVGGVALAYYVYRRIYDRQRMLPTSRRPDDPVRGVLGPVFRFFERKWLVDELYNGVIVNRYVDLSWFLADKVDWRFWHDWFHDKVIVGGYNGLSRLLAVKVDLGGIDKVSSLLARFTGWLSSVGRRIQTGFVSTYAITFFIGVVLIIGYFLLRLTTAR